MRNIIQRQRKNGFTIVELVVVIIVIGILTSIVIVGYGQWRKTTIANAVKSDLNQAITSIQSARNFSPDSTGAYPATLPSTFTASKDITVTGGGRPGGTFFCVQAVSATDSSIQYYVSNKQQSPAPGSCAVTTTKVISQSSPVTVYSLRTDTGLGWARGVIAANDGNIYTSSITNNYVAKINPTTGAATAFSGTGTSGSTDGSAQIATFKGLGGIVQDKLGNFYVTDTNNNAVRKIDPTGTVSTFVGIHQATNLAMDSAGNLYVAADDSSNCFATVSSGHIIYKITPGGTVTNFAGSGICGVVDGSASTAQFHNPYFLAIDEKNNALYVTEGSCRIRKIQLNTRVVSTYAGSDTCGYSDGPAASATFSYVGGVAVDNRGVVYVVSQSNIRVITLDGQVYTLATGAGGGQPLGLAFDSNNNLWVTGLDGTLTKVTIP